MRAPRACKRLVREVAGRERRRAASAAAPAPSAAGEWATMAWLRSENTSKASSKRAPGGRPCRPRWRPRRRGGPRPPHAAVTSAATGPKGSCEPEARSGDRPGRLSRGGAEERRSRGPARTAAGGRGPPRCGRWGRRPSGRHCAPCAARGSAARGPIGRDQVPGRLEPEHAAGMGRPADRAAEVRAELEGAHPGRNRGRGAARRAAGRAGRVEGVVR